MNEGARYILAIIISLFGGLLIRDAVIAYNDEKYFRFGYNIMLTVWTATQLVGLICHI